MTNKSVVLVGNPDSGKSNFAGRLWLALKSRKFDIVPGGTPTDIVYMEELVEHILCGNFAPRTDKNDRDRSIKISIVPKNNQNNVVELFIPDVSGEIWKNAVEKYEIPKNWMQAMKSASAALLFVRVLSELNVEPLDWVTSKELLHSQLAPHNQADELPTQVKLIELLRLLEETLNGDGKRPKVAIIVTAWDLLHEAEAKAGPEKYLKTQFPMFAGRIEDNEKLDIKIFGSSIVGGDLSDDTFRNCFFESDIDDTGFVVSRNEIDEIVQTKDITIPIQWLLGR